MSTISSWMISIAGVIILSVLAEFVLPEGQINKYIKVIFSFIILLVVILPLPKLVGKSFDLSTHFKEDMPLQEDYLYQLNINKLEVLNSGILEKLAKEKLERVQVSINANVFCENLEIFGVYVDLSDYAYEKNPNNTDISKTKDKIISILNCFDELKNVEVSFNE